MTTFLETERLILRAPQLSDLNHLVALHADPRVMRYLGDARYTRGQLRKSLDHAIRYQEKHGMSFCPVFEKTSGDFVGQAGLVHLEFDDTQSEMEIAYRLRKKFWGKGYATELVKRLIQWGFEHLSVEKLVAVVHPDNRASQKVLEKAGLMFIGYSEYRNEAVLQYEVYKNDAIELVPYDLQWPELAALEIKKLYEVMPKSHIVDIQHVGSTAIPGIQAKPIIDIQIAVHSLAAAKALAIDVLQALGYEYWSENPDPDRMFFVKGMPPFGEKRSHHIHIVESTSKHWQGKIQFRDYLRSHPEEAREYERLKTLLASQYMHDREQYTLSKTEFVNRILEDANLALEDSNC